MTRKLRRLAKVARKILGETATERECLELAERVAASLAARG